MKIFAINISSDRTINLMPCLYSFFIAVILASLTQSMITQTTMGNETGDVLHYISSEIGGFDSNTRENPPSIGDALSTSTAISNTTSGEEKISNEKADKINEYLANVTPHTPSIGDALSTSSSISNHTKS